MNTKNIIRDSFKPNLLRSAVYYGIESLAHAYQFLMSSKLPDKIPSYWHKSLSEVVDAINRDIQHKEYVRSCSLKLLREGEMEKLPCKCGNENSEIHHHDYYAHPSDVTWLCKRCHEQEHSRLDAEKGEPEVQCNEYEFKMLRIAVSVAQFRNGPTAYVTCFREDEDDQIEFRKWEAKQREQEELLMIPD